MVRRKEDRITRASRLFLAGGAKAKANKALALAKQNKKMLNKTIENKQVNALRPPIFVTSSGVSGEPE